RAGRPRPAGGRARRPGPLARLRDRLPAPGGGQGGGRAARRLGGAPVERQPAAHGGGHGRHRPGGRPGRPEARRGPGVPPGAGGLRGQPGRGGRGAAGGALRRAPPASAQPTGSSAREKRRGQRSSTRSATWGSISSFSGQPRVNPSLSSLGVPSTTNTGPEPKVSSTTWTSRSGSMLFSSVQM